MTDEGLNRDIHLALEKDEAGDGESRDGNIFFISTQERPLRAITNQVKKKKGKNNKMN